MQKNRKKQPLLILIFFLLVFAFFLFQFDLKLSSREFIFAMLDVGQGDAIFIQSPTGVQVLVDTGPPRKVLNKLSGVMPVFDRSIDAVIITNPDLDHLGGLSDILNNYKVGVVLEPGTTNDSEAYKDFKKIAEEKKIPDILARRGMVLNLGRGAKLEILFPDREVLSWPTNKGSVIGRLTYGEHSILLTGDATSETEKIILEENQSDTLKSEILKVGHHGSRFSSSAEFLKAIQPKWTFISVGKDNTYGHPHPEVLDRLVKIGAQIFRTDQAGTIIFECAKMDRCEIKKLKN